MRTAKEGIRTENIPKIWLIFNCWKSVNVKQTCEIPRYGSENWSASSFSPLPKMLKHCIEVFWRNLPPILQQSRLWQSIKEMFPAPADSFLRLWDIVYR